MDAVIPPPCKIPEGQKPETAATSGGSWPKESRNLGGQAPKQLWNRGGLGVTPMPHKMIMRWKWRI